MTSKGGSPNITGLFKHYQKMRQRLSFMLFVTKKYILKGGRFKQSHSLAAEREVGVMSTHCLDGGGVKGR